MGRMVLGHDAFPSTLTCPLINFGKSVSLVFEFTVRAFLEGVQRKTLSAWHISQKACLQGLKFSAEHLLMATKPGAFVCQYSTLSK
ncbi:MAG: hypothetical protein Q9M22_01710 [Mariprofundaceae bacterium]|nr:hypothetical protein [Mariprofundaceae bacterium]